MIIDAAVHPVMPTEEYETRIPHPWTDGVTVPTAFGRLWDAPFNDIPDLEHAADPVNTAATLFDERGVDVAVLTPQTRGLLPNRLHAAAAATATNEWLRDVWLDNPSGDRFYASIRVAVEAPELAVREIERWSEDPRFVQIAVPLRTWAHYGDEQFYPIWRAAAAAGMPVYVQDDLATAAEMSHTLVGQPITFAENDAQRALLCLVHLASLLASGVHERLPDLRFVFGDGGLDLAPALLWRLNNDWRNGRVEVPWIEESPSVLAERFARFVTQVHDGRPDGEHLDEGVVRLSHAEKVAIYGSHHPYWDQVSQETAVSGCSPDAREQILAGNALEVTPRLRTAVAEKALSA
jgi:predicted TIM-barrel fold metal-dependent hydrolase